jgi:hypothetical protein
MPAPQVWGAALRTSSSTCSNFLPTCDPRLVGWQGPINPYGRALPRNCTPAPPRGSSAYEVALQGAIGDGAGGRAPAAPCTAGHTKRQNGALPVYTALKSASPALRAIGRT